MSRSKRPRCNRGRTCGVCAFGSVAQRASDRRRREQVVGALDIDDGLIDWDAMSPCERAGACLVVDEPCPHMVTKVGNEQEAA